VRNGSKLRTEIYRAQEISKILDTVEIFFSDQFMEAPGLEAELEPAEVA
jgi:hypothetical protein